MWHLVTRGNIQQISYIPQTEQHLPIGLMPAPSGECNYYVCVCACVLTSLIYKLLIEV